MYNGNGNGNGNNYGNGSSGRFSAIPPLYLYIGIGIAVLLGIWLLSSFFRAGIEGYFTLAAGVLLVLGNLRDLIANPYAQRSNIALLNTLIGGGLIFYFLGRGGFLQVAHGDRHPQRDAQATAPPRARPSSRSPPPVLVSHGRAVPEGIPRRSPTSCQNR